MYNSLRTLSFRLSPDVARLPHQLATVEFPEHWKAPLRELATNGRHNPVQTSVPIASLNKAIRALVPDLVYISKKAHLSGPQTWLHSAHPVDPSALHLIVHAWVRTAFPDTPRRAQFLSELRPDALRWQPQELDLAAWNQAPNGTAASGDDAFVLLPDFLAAQLSDLGVTFQLGSHSLRFRRAPVPPGGKGAELISWPPQEFSNNRGRWFWSVSMTIKVQTVPFQSFPVIHFDLGMHRWMSKRFRLPKGETSVYLLTSVPWIQGLHHSQSFQVAPLGSRHAQPQSGETPEWRATWGKNSCLTTILDALHPSHKFPDPQALVDDPASALCQETTPNAAIAYHTRMRANHEAGTGLMPGDRSRFAEQIARTLAPHFEFTAAPTRKKFPSSTVTSPFLEKEPTDETCRARRQAVGDAVGGHLTLEIWYQSTNLRDALIQEVSAMFDFPLPTSLPGTLSKPELQLTIRAQSLGGLGDVLDSGTKPRSNPAGLPPAIAARIKHVCETVPPPLGPTGALIELGGAGAFNTGEDPKDALRLAFARAGRITQFITPPTEEEDDTALSNRVLNSVRDLMRQTGPRIEYPHVAGLPSNLNYVGIWLINQNHTTTGRGPMRMPVMVHIATGTGEIRATAPGLNGWLPYDQALLAMGQRKGQSLQSNRVVAWVDDCVKNVPALGDTLLLCHAQNMRQFWKWLGNTRLTRDAIGFVNEAPKPIESRRGLRIVRIRDGDETPQWYAAENQVPGFSRGLFQMGERVYASTHGNPPQFTTSPKASKFSSWTTAKPHDPAPNIQAWNPGLFELTVVSLQPEDRETPYLWAALTHKLRDAAMHYGYATALPWPLHLAKQMEEYALLVEESDDDS